MATTSSPQVGSLGTSASSSAEASKVEEITGEAKQSLTQFSENVRSRAMRMAEERRSSVIDPVKSIAGTADDMVSKLESDGSEGAARVARQVTGELQKAVTYAEDTPIEQLIDDLVVRARRSPMMFVGGAFAIGFAATRLLKSSPVSAPKQLTAGSGSIGGTPTGGGAALPPARPLGGSFTGGSGSTSGGQA